MPNSVTTPQEMKLKSLARQYDERCIRVLGGLVTSEETEPHIRLEAIKILLDRGHGRPKGEKTHKHAGADGKGPITVKIVYPPRDET